MRLTWSQLVVSPHCYGRKLIVVQSQCLSLRSEMRLTPPQRAEQQMAGLVIPWMVMSQSQLLGTELEMSGTALYTLGLAGNSNFKW